MSSPIYPGVLGALLLICLCHSASTTSPAGNSNETNSTSREDNARCLSWLWGRSLGDDIISGNPDNRDPNYAEEIKYGDVENLRKNRFNDDLPLKIVIHGFTKNYVSESVQLIKDAYLKMMALAASSPTPNASTGYNVVMVDWEPLGNPKVKVGSGLFYRFAVRNTLVVGERVGELVHFLMTNGAVKSLDDVHIIGFSLGAHVAGNAGDKLQKLTGQVPARVTGLDPAGPAFYDGLTFSHRRLQKTDGRFVDVIHANKGGMGMWEEIGHADFYPNGGGQIQPQCEVEYAQKIADGSSTSNGGGIWDTKVMLLESCSHNKGPQFFALSILKTDMIACKCRSYNQFKSQRCPCTETAIFGEYCDPNVRGRFYLDT